MSAFLVTKTHIDVIVTAARFDRYRSLPKLPGAILRSDPVAFASALYERDGQVTAPDLDIGSGCFNDEFGRALWLANAESLCARYTGDRERMEREGEFAEIRAYHFRPAVRSHVEAIKACHCFDYQACEVSDYETTWAKRTIDAIERTLINTLPGYEAAPWGVDDAVSA